MTQLDVAIAARAFVEGRARRAALYRHRRLQESPGVIVLWQLGAEPFAAAAVAWGCSREELRLSVAGEPRNRELAFRALLPFAQWVNARFEKAVEGIDLASYDEIPRHAPQFLVANRATVEMLGRLGRRLAYLPLDGPRPADFALVQLGRHLQFLHRHHSFPGQQLLLSMTDLLNAHWITSQSPEERQNLAALEAFIAPPGGKHGHVAACEVEREAIGPIPGEDEDTRVQGLMEDFNRWRGDRTDEATIKPLLRAIEEHYRPLVKRTWDLVWRCRERETGVREAPSVERRWEQDCRELKYHMLWNQQSGRRRVRQTSRQAAMLMRRLEGARARLEAEEACEDPIRMIPYILDNKAIEGRVAAIDLSYKELAGTRMMRRPLLTLECDDDCLMPEGRELWWSSYPRGYPWVVQSVRRRSGGGAVVALKLMTSTLGGVPEVGETACFSIHRASDGYHLDLPKQAPWPHEPAVEAAPPAPIEEP